MKKSFLIFIMVLAILSILLSGTASPDKPQRDVIIGFHQMPGPSEKALIHSEGGVTKHTYHLIPAIFASLPEQAIANMRKNPRIAYIENDIAITALTDGYNEYNNSWGVSHIGSEIVHNNSITGTSVKVAVIDTGIDYIHYDLDDNYKGGYDFVFNDSDPMDDSSTGHGTHVAGIIAAENNGIGVVGVAPNTSLYAVKVLDGAGFGNASWVIAGIEWAVDKDMDIATMSLGSSQYSEALQDACDTAYNAGVLLVAAAGNTNGGDVLYPAKYDSVIAVTATDLNDQRAFFSPISPEVELAAPGVDIMSTIQGDNYSDLRGTSQAAPHVAGTAALIVSSKLQDLNEDGMINNEDVRLQLQLTAKDLGEEIGKDDIYGYGLVDAETAVFAIPITPEMPTLRITRTSGSPINNAKNVSLSEASYQITIRNNGLSKVDVEVFEEGAIRDDLSSSYHFNSKKAQKVTFYLDASRTTFDVTFFPKGKPMTFANINVMKWRGGK